MVPFLLILVGQTTTFVVVQVLLLSPQGSQWPVAAHPCLRGSGGGTQPDGTVPPGEVWGLASWL